MPAENEGDQPKGKKAKDEETDDIGAKSKMLEAKLVEYAGRHETQAASLIGKMLQTKGFDQVQVEVANLVAKLVAEEVFTEELKEDFEFEETKEAFENEKSKPKAPRDKASSDKSAKGPSSRRKGYG